MDPIGEDVLSKIKKVKGLEEAIIAGGFVRDHIMGGRFKDIDIFIPHNDYSNQNIFLDWFDTQRDFTDFKVENQNLLDGSYQGTRMDVFSTKYLDTIPVQFMFHGYSDSQSVIDEFDFNICKCYFDGDEIVVAPEADKDFANNQATLVNVKSIQHFPNHLMRFNRWKEKYPQLKFATTLSLVTKEYLAEREDYYREYYRKQYERKLQSVASTGNVGPGHPESTSGGIPWITQYKTLSKSQLKTYFNHP